MTLERSTRVRVATALVLGLVLGAGVVLGVALDRKLGTRGVSAQEGGWPDGRPGAEGRSRGFDPRSRDSPRDSSQARDSSQRRPSLVVDQVGLSEAQKERVDSIVGYYRSQMRALHEEFDEAYNTRFRELNRMARAEVVAVLTEEQRTAYDSLQAVWERRRQERRQDSIPGGVEGRSGEAGERSQR